ncbi:hypothetical protein RMCBS344292_15369 [Rhizopus microsporus]|nr:hypothetical protein RMCBS344292_15369 [Rhizopus microsporus]
MKLSLLFTSFSAIFYLASADTNEGSVLVKREHGLPYSSLPSTSCSVPATCSNIGSSVNCRCSDQITVCINSSNQYCWGSQTLTSTSCPSAPSSCGLSGSQSSCLCNSNNILCADNANNYCYGTISAGSVTLTGLPNASGGLAPGASVSANVTSPSSSMPASSSTPASTNVAGFTTINAPTNVVTTSPTPTSDAQSTSVKALLTLGCALIAYIASN